jgi:hypothetical protein
MGYLQVLRFGGIRTAERSLSQDSNQRRRRDLLSVNGGTLPFPYVRAIVGLVLVAVCAVEYACYWAVVWLAGYSAVTWIVVALVAQPGPRNLGRRKVQTITAAPIKTTATINVQVRCLELKYFPLVGCECPSFFCSRSCR